MRVAAVVTMVLAVGGVSGARAQTPHLVSDLGTQRYLSDGRNPEYLAATPSALFFTGNYPANGREVLRLDAAGALTFLVDATPNASQLGDPQRVTAAGDSVFWVRDSELWTSDGTPAGTALVRRFTAATPTQLTGVPGGLFFILAADANPMRELWWSDGTEVNTRALGVPSPEGLTAHGTQAYFSAFQTATGSELWTSDGTLAGTRMVKDVCPGTCSGTSSEIASAGGLVYFGGYDAANDNELWRSDGTEAGTVPIGDLLPNGSSPGLYDLTAFGSSVLYSVGVFSGDLWFSDGTAQGTRRLRQSLDVEAIHDAGALAFFVGRDAAGGRELWKTDGTIVGTARVVDGCPGPCDFVISSAMGSVGGVLVFRRDNFEVWRSDGTAAGTFLLRTFLGEGNDEPLPRLGGSVYFAANDGTNGKEVWKSDGSVEGTVVVQDYGSSDSWLYSHASAGDHALFIAVTPGEGAGLWSSAGEAATTHRIDLGPESGVVYFDAPLGERAVFSTQGSAAFGTWITDGTASGTTLLGPLLATPSLDDANGLVFFGGSTTPSNVEPWRTDGTPEGTFQLKELVPGLAGSNPQNFVPFLGQTYFGAFGALWLTDGTSAGTRAFLPRFCDPLTSVSQHLLLACSDSATGVDLWSSDGTTEGTRHLKDITPGMGSTFFSAAIVVDDLAFLVAGDRLWRTDGTEMGTFVLTPTGVVVGVSAGNPGSESANPRVLDGVVYFMGQDPVAGRELWRSDGTVAGTARVLDINPGPGDGVHGLASAGGQLVLAAYQLASGIELWRSDGTASGTLPLPEVQPGPASSTWGDLQAAGRNVFFPGDDGTTGFEPWAVALPTGAVSVGDTLIREADAGTTDTVFEVRLESASTAPVEVAFATVSGSATMGTDFLPRSGILTFAPGVTLLSVAVPVVGDLVDEPTEAFGLELSAVGGTIISDGHGSVVVVDDDAPALSAAHIRIAEGQSGSSNASFTVTLTTVDGSATAEAKTVQFRTEPVTATPGADYVDVGGTLTFPAGTASGSTLPVTVPVLADTLEEPDETFSLRLIQSGDATVPTPAVATILDDDGLDAGRTVELVHGSRVVATLEPASGRTSDLDFYVLREHPSASYEIVVDETSGDAVPLTVERLATDGSTVLQAATSTGTGAALSLRWSNSFSLLPLARQIRVRSQSCGSSCSEDDRYRVRAYETTLSVARFNNTGGQATILLLQNTTGTVVQSRISFWHPSGTLLMEVLLPVPARGVTVVPTAQYWASGSGSLTIAHDAPYGALVGKVVALEPATGFSFDTPLTIRPR